VTSKTKFLELLERLDTNFIIGVAGDSGSGKTTFTEGIRRILGDELVSSFSMDDYHTEDREMRKKTGNLPLHPECNNLSLLAHHLAELKRGNPIVKPIYDHKTGAFAPEEVFKPTRIIIIEGLHAFYTPELRTGIDFSIFVDPEREVKWRWKMKRDVEKRGHAKEDVEAEMRMREPLFKKYIDHQKIYAEVVIKIKSSTIDRAKEVAIELIQEVPKIPLKGIDLHFDLSNLMRASERDFRLEFRNDFYYGKPVARMILDGHIRHEAVRGLESTIKDYTGLHEHTLLDSRTEYTGITELVQLLICWRFLEKMDYLLEDLDRALAV
jgi:phosphoribulokinase